MRTTHLAKPSRPAVYLDQWVWIRMAQASVGRPRVAGDDDALEAIRAASVAGVAFPLSATHYEETLRISDPNQRRDLATVMAIVSEMRTIRSQTDLVRHQFLCALHETVGRPTFRPAPIEPLGIGVYWAFHGQHAFLRVIDAEGRVVIVDWDWLRRINQYAEFALLAGPTDEDAAALAEDGYVSPRSREAAPGNRLAWEQLLEERLAENRRPAPAELRVWLLARELSHEYLDLLNAILAEYRLSISAISPVADGVKSRKRIVDFVERVPTLRISADMKVEIFRDTNRRWNWNMLRDIDALSLAIPYCDVVVADKDAAALAHRTQAPTRHGTVVTSRLGELVEVLADLTATARSIVDDRNGWDQVAPGSGFKLTSPTPLTAEDVAAGRVVRMLDSEGAQVTARSRGAEHEPRP